MSPRTPSTTTATTRTRTSMAAACAGDARVGEHSLGKGDQAGSTPVASSARVAQLAERCSRKAKVARSIRAVGSKKMHLTGPLITTACERLAGSGVCAASSDRSEQLVDNRQVVGSSPTPRTMATGITDKFTAGACDRAAVAQSVERRNENPGVAGSIPARGTMEPIGPLWRAMPSPITGPSTGCELDSKSNEVGSIPSGPAQRLQ